MLWWFVGVWLASGAVLPAFFLLRMAHRWLAASKIDPKGLHALSGLVGFGIGVLILWSVCSFSDSGIAMRGTPSASVVAQPIELSPAQFSAAQAGPPLLGEAYQVALIQPRIGAFGRSAGNDASPQADTAVPQARPIAQLHAQLVKHGLVHRDARGPSVGPYITHSSSSGVWLFAPNGNEGANN